MHYIVLERLSRQQSYVHSIDGRFKLIALLILLLGIATTDPFSRAQALGYFLLLTVGLYCAKLPVKWALLRAAAVLLFPAVFAAIVWWTQGAERAVTLLAKSYLSGLAVILLVASTPLPVLLQSATKLGVPDLIVSVTQFIYRYFFLIFDEAKRMWAAAHLRGAGRRSTSIGERMTVASGVLAVLFARSMGKAESIHNSMICRGFTGRLPEMQSRSVTARDSWFLTVTVLAVAVLWVLPRVAQ